MSKILNKKVLVTGGAGFVGHHLVKRLLEDDNQVNILDDLSTGRMDNLNKDATFFQGDIRDSKILSEAAAGCEVIFHLAARVELQKTIVDPSDCFSVNVSGTANVIIEALKNKNRKLVFASSCAVYPLNPKQPLSEDMATVGETPYAISKVVCENLMKFYHRTLSLNYISLRCFNIYGLRQRVDSPYAAVVPKFIDAAKKNKELLLFGGGNQTRDFIHIDDIIDAYILASKSLEVGEFNVGTASEVKIKDLAKIIIKIGASGSLTKNMPKKHGDALKSVSNIEKIRSKLGFSPNIRLDEGISMIYEQMI